MADNTWADPATDAVCLNSYPYQRSLAKGAQEGFGQPCSTLDHKPTIDLLSDRDQLGPFRDSIARHWHWRFQHLGSGLL